MNDFYILEFSYSHSFKPSIWNKKCKLEFTIILTFNILYIIYCTRFCHFNILKIAHLLKLANFFPLFLKKSGLIKDEKASQAWKKIEAFVFQQLQASALRLDRVYGQDRHFIIGRNIFRLSLQSFTHCSFSLSLVLFLSLFTQESEALSESIGFLGQE